jgi:excisionase family DNA binding protein
MAQPAHEAFDDLLTFTEAARLLGKREATVARLVAEGKLPSIRGASGEPKIRRIDIEAFSQAEHEDRLERVREELGFSKGDSDDS